MTREDLRGIIEGIADEQLKQILDIHSADIGRAKAAETELTERLQKAEGQVSALQELQREAEEIKEKYSELQKVAEQQAEQERITQLDNRFKAASGDAKFLNSFTRKGIFDRFTQALDLDENKGKSDSEVFAMVTEGTESLFAADSTAPMVVASTSGFGGDLTDGDIREIMGLSSQHPKWCSGLC